MSLSNLDPGSALALLRSEESCMYYGKDKDVVVSIDEAREAFSFLLYTIFLMNTNLDIFCTLIAYGIIFYLHCSMSL